MLAVYKRHLIERMQLLDAVSDPGKTIAVLSLLGHRIVPPCLSVSLQLLGLVRRHGPERAGSGSHSIMLLSSNNEFLPDRRGQHQTSLDAGVERLSEASRS
jgi:hypothetical protein